MPLQATSGAASQDAFGGNGVAVVPTYIEDVFSTYLYTGNGTSQTITNNIDLSTKGGLVWLKSRSGAQYHGLWDTLRGPTHALNSGLDNVEYTTTSTQDLTGFTSSGFSLGTYWNNSSNQNEATYASWTFRKQPKFFDVVTYTGNDTAGRQIAHSLGSTPGCIIVKCTSNTSNWPVYHAGVASSFLTLNLTNANQSGLAKYYWGDDTSFIAPTSTVFTVGGANAGYDVNKAGATYVAYLFAHDAGGFGLTGTDNVISCGSFTTDGAGAATVSLGYEPQWFLFKRSDSTSNWRILDVMRGGSLTQSSPLIPNTSGAESSFGSFWSPTATGFNIINQAASSTWIYIAIRRGPMKVPTDGTKVYATSTSDTVNNPEYVSNFPVDMEISTNTLYGGNKNTSSRLLQGTYLFANTTAAESNGTEFAFDYNNGWATNAAHDSAYRSWMFRRAPGYFDEVCYAGNNSFNRGITHNLAVAPELIITKVRTTTSNWAVYAAATGLGNPMSLNTTAAASANPYVWGTTAPSSTFFYIGDDTRTNGGGYNYVSYLFATCPGVSKVGSYTGTGTTQQIDCGFTAGARFVLIKRTNSTGDWYVWDTARGIVSGNDPYLLLNSTAAQVTNTDYIDTYSAGFEISSTAPAAINANGGSFIFLAIS